MRQILQSLLVACLALALGACHYLHLASGQTRLLLQRKSIPRLLADPAVKPELKARLRLALAAREFASDQLGLPRNRSYTMYADIDRPWVMYNVFATPRLSLEPVTHCFPVAGCVAYQGYYTRDRAEAAARRLRRAGNDVAISGVAAYSTLGHFADPVLSSMTGWSDAQLVGTIFHELAHQQLYVKGDTAFNEAWASFVEQEGLRQWFAATGTTPPDPATAQRRRQFVELVLETREHLAALYASTISDKAKEQGKQDEFERMRQSYRQLRETTWGGHGDWDAWMAEPLNNARLLPFGLYDAGVPAFAALFRRCQGDWICFHAAVADVAAEGADARAGFLHETGKAD